VCSSWHSTTLIPLFPVLSPPLSLLLTKTLSLSCTPGGRLASRLVRGAARLSTSGRRRGGCRRSEHAGACRDSDSPAPSGDRGARPAVSAACSCLPQLPALAFSPSLPSSHPSTLSPPPGPQSLPLLAHSPPRVRFNTPARRACRSKPYSQCCLDQRAALALSAFIVLPTVSTLR